MSKPALLLMDLQEFIVNRFVGDSGKVFSERFNIISEAARRSRIPVIYVVVKFRKDFPEVSPQNKAFGQLRSAGMPLVEGEAAVEIHSSVAPKEGDIVVTKRRVGAFSGSDLDVVLRGQGVDHLILTGISTSGVVLSTLRVAADLDYKITVLSDCCYDKDEEVHRVLTEKIFPGQADVIKADAWLTQLKSLASS
jgi:nicotinamidase-related amidase